MVRSKEAIMVSPLLEVNEMGYGACQRADRRASSLSVRNTRSAPGSRDGPVSARRGVDASPEVPAAALR
jgi:hypothetical protein